MPAYCGLMLDAAGVVRAIVLAACEDDTSALDWLNDELREAVRYDAAELWQGARRVAKVARPAVLWHTDGTGFDPQS